MANTALLTFNQISILFLIIIVGFVCSKKKIINTEFESKGSELLINITAPALILTSFTFKHSRELMAKGLMLMGTGFIVHIIAICICIPAFKKIANDQKRRILIFATIFSNCIFMSFPLIDGVFGSEGIFLASFYIVSFNIIIWTYGYMLMTGGSKISINTILNSLKNPAIPAIGIGIILLVANISLPEPILKSLELIGSMTTPLSMLLVGSQLSRSKITDLITDKNIFFVSFLKLILIPAIVMLLVYFLRLPAIAGGVAVMLAGMPTAANTTIFARLYLKEDNESVFASKCVAATTLFSMITIPLVISAVTLILK